MEFRFRVYTDQGIQIAICAHPIDAAAILISRDLPGYSVRSGPSAGDIVLRYKRSCIECQQLTQAAEIISHNDRLPLACRLHVQ